MPIIFFLANFVGYHVLHSSISSLFQYIYYCKLLVTKGNIQKLEQVNFVATDTKPSDPLPLRVQFCGNKINPNFFLEIEYMIAKTNFTLGAIEKSIFLGSVIMLYFSIN